MAHVLLSVRVEDCAPDHATWVCSCGRIGEVIRGRNKHGQWKDEDEAGVIAVKRHQSHVRLCRRWGT